MNAAVLLDNNGELKATESSRNRADTSGDKEVY